MPWLFVLIGFYLVYAVLMWFAQRWVMFPGAHWEVVAEAPVESGEQRVAWVGPERQAEVVFLLPQGVTPAPAVIFAYGNGEHMGLWRDAFSELQRRGYGVLLVEYPGYGRSGGQPSKRNIEQSMRDAYDYLIAQPDVDRKRIVGYGRSLGGAAVCGLSEQRRLAALILESSFSSVAAIAVRYGLWGPLLRDPFDNVRSLEVYKGPTLILHGESDSVIPVSHAHVLMRAAAHGELELVACGHNDCPRPWKRILRFLSEHDLAPGGDQE